MSRCKLIKGESKFEEVLSQQRLVPYVNLKKFPRQEDEIMYEEYINRLKFKKSQRKDSKKSVSLASTTKNSKKDRIHEIKNKTITKKDTTYKSPRYKTRRSTRIQRAVTSDSENEKETRQDPNTVVPVFVDLTKFSREEDKTLFDAFLNKKESQDQASTDLCTLEPADTITIADFEKQFVVPLSPKVIVNSGPTDESTQNEKNEDSVMYNTANEETLSNQLVSELNGQIKKTERTRFEIDLDPDENKIKIWFDNDRETHSVEEEVNSELSQGRYCSEIENTQVKVDYSLTDNKCEVWYKNRLKKATGEEESNEVSSSIDTPASSLRRFSRYQLEDKPDPLNDQELRRIVTPLPRRRLSEKFVKFSEDQDLSKVTSSPHRQRRSEVFFKPDQDESLPTSTTSLKRRHSEFFQQPLRDQEDITSSVSSPQLPSRRLKTNIGTAKSLNDQARLKDATPRAPRHRQSIRFCKLPQDQQRQQQSKEAATLEQSSLEKTVPKFDIQVLLRLITYITVLTYCFYKILQVLMI